MKYEYMVIYQLKNGKGDGTGRTTVITKNKIKTIKDIERIDKDLKEKYGLKFVMVIDFKLLNRKLF